MDAHQVLTRQLAPTATTQERIKGLAALGIPVTIIAAATRSSQSTIRNWSAGTGQPRYEAAIVLDDFRAIARKLLTGMEPDRAAQWFLSRDPELFDGSRPFEMISVDPMDVLAAASQAVLDAQTEAEVVPISARTKSRTADSVKGAKRRRQARVPVGSAG